jgi:hypothetical protein
MGFEPLIGKQMDGCDGDPSAREAANRIAYFRRARFSSFGRDFLDRGFRRDPRL